MSEPPRPTDPQLPRTVWIVVSDAGYPAYFLGYGRTKRELKLAYSRNFGGDLEVAGYRVVKVTMDTAPAGARSYR